MRRPFSANQNQGGCLMNPGDERDPMQSGRQKEGPTTADFAGRSSPPQEGQAGNNRLAQEERTEPLFPQSESEKFQAHWSDIQGSFVDEPRQAVEAADRLVATAMQRLAETFADERARLEEQWDRGEDVSTEELRVTLRRYRAFFGRLLSI
jgi:hypothetical protein